jgi:hypothetical protein
MRDHILFLHFDAPYKIAMRTQWASSVFFSAMSSMAKISFAYRRADSRAPMADADCIEIIAEKKLGE